MVMLKVAHAPAGATTLIVSLGIITRPWHLAVIEIAVALLCLQAICFNRLAGLNYPLWVGPVDSAMEELRTGRRLEERKEIIRPKRLYLSLGEHFEQSGEHEAQARKWKAPRVAARRS
jgi:hypothetical protein